jgi:hypothetical protein
VAFGWNDVLNVLDVKGMLDVVRFRGINVDARSPESLWPDRSALAPERNSAFLRECVKRFRTVNFADQESGAIYLHLDAGRPAWIDPAALDEAAKNADTRAGLMAVAPAGFGRAAMRGQSRLAPAERAHTLGAWGAKAGSIAACE